MQTFQPQHTRAAILLHTVGKDIAPIKEQEMACRSYCQQQRYQLSEQDIYPDEGQSLCSDAPQLVRLRLLVVQGHLDVLVLAQSAYLGDLPLWEPLPVSRAIEDFYRHGARIESAIPRYGIHDLYRQMLLDAIQFVKQFGTARINDPRFSTRKKHSGMQP